MPRLLACVLLALTLAGCVTDGVAPRTSKRDDDPDEPKRLCEASSIGGQPKSVCY